MNLRLVVYAIVALVLAVSWAASCVLFQAASMNAKVAPLAVRDFPRLTVIAVGTGGPYENPDRGGPSLGIALGEWIGLVDAGRAVAEGLRAAQVPVAQPSSVFLTSVLPENTVGLDDLLFTGWLTGRAQPLRVVGPPGTSELVEELRAAHAAGMRAEGDALGLPPAGGGIEAVEVGGGWSERVGDMTITAGALEGGPVAALAWRFEHDDVSVVVGGAGWDADRLVQLAAGADMLLVEAVYFPTEADIEAGGLAVDVERLRREEALHTSVLEVGEIASRARVDALGLVRLRPPPLLDLQLRRFVGRTYDGAVWVPEDGEEYEP